MAMNDDIVFEGGDWKIIDSRDIDYDKAELVPGESDLLKEEFRHQRLSTTSSVSSSVVASAPPSASAATLFRR